MRFARIGQRIRDFDDAYAAKVEDLVRGDATEGARRVISELVSAPLTYGIGKSSHTFKDNPKGFIADHAAVLGIQGLSAGVRYAAPAGLITAAGAGLADLTQNFYDSMSNTPVLPS